ncbi:hypothetical protein A2943_02375 [Candidatus Adlerbacteria bacterium RIFCSPLOWO2_01_FULL_51_16]|uniref:Uncharacterized protein n=1 Tax=Candidatus Adlerbacteria bacterium RIFCSPLOWO2_01_FULL_51_16 TaxID=1797243 RepID=A0A1F4XGA8_9BACT|nr:MAG: hypothetical protein A2943_02375 [Candidatus Adlerbacteria bacterium RIFCSPLOWO2_01_FULL_51_16]
MGVGSKKEANRNVPRQWVAKLPVLLNMEPQVVPKIDSKVFAVHAADGVSADKAVVTLATYVYDPPPKLRLVRNGGSPRVARGKVRCVLVEYRTSHGLPLFFVEHKASRHCSKISGIR